MLKIHLEEILKGTKLHSSYSTSLLFFRRVFIQTLSVTLSWNKIFLLKFKYIISVILITLTMFRLQIYDNQCLNCKQHKKESIHSCNFQHWKYFIKIQKKLTSVKFLKRTCMNQFYFRTASHWGEPDITGPGTRL